MNPFLNRRTFLKSTTIASVGAMIGSKLGGLRDAVAKPATAATKPLVISSANGLRAIEKAMQMIQQGADALDAVIAGVNIVEHDPKDHSVGYGGLPNEDGVVELDSSVMHGPTHRAGAVGALRNIKNPSKIAQMVMERTDHVFLVGEGALRFAKAHGFKEEDLLTDEAREIWLKWKETLSNKDNWLPPHMITEKEIGAIPDSFKPFFDLHGTINCDAIDLRGNISGVTTTSGLAFKLAGRVGDSPIIGAGLYVDNEVGAAGSTGRGEANLISCNSVMIVEWMRQGKSPEEACLLACQRVHDHNKEGRLQDDDGRPNFSVNFYALNMKGEYGCAGVWEGAKMAVHDGKEAKLVDGAYLFKRKK